MFLKHHKVLLWVNNENTVPLIPVMDLIKNWHNVSETEPWSVKREFAVITTTLTSVSTLCLAGRLGTTFLWSIHSISCHEVERERRWSKYIRYVKRYNIQLSIFKTLNLEFISGYIAFLPDLFMRKYNLASWNGIFLLDYLPLQMEMLQAELLLKTSWPYKIHFVKKISD